MSILLRDLSEVQGAIEGGPFPTNLQLVDGVLSGNASGPLADFILERMAFCFGEVSEEKVREIISLRERALSEIDLLVDKACENIEENRGHCYRAGSRQEAIDIVKGLVGSGKTVVKSFDFAVEEIGVGAELRRENIVLDSSVPLAVSFLLPRVGEEALSERLRDLDISGQIEEFLAAYYRRKLYEADVGITGVRALAADPGAMSFLPDSGIDRLITMSPEVHIIVAGLEEIVATYAEAFAITEFISRHGKGEYSFLGFVGGPSKTGDIEKRVTYGAHGPREFHVIVLDDGRSRAIEGRSPAVMCPRASKLPCPEVWPAWKEILGLEGGVREVKSIGRCPFIS